MDLERVKTIAEWPQPTSYHDIQVFLGFCNFYRRFIHRYSEITAPLTELLKGSVKGKKPGAVTLVGDADQAFRRLLQAFQEAPVLRHFDPARPIRLETDASAVARAAILSQPDDEGRFHPVAFSSAKFKGAETRYGTPDQEMLAIVEAFKHWRHYLEGSNHPVEVLSDHLNLRSFMNQPRFNGRQARWCMYLSPFDFEIRHQPGKKNPADAPSRRPDYEPPAEPNVWFPSLQNKMTKAGVFMILTGQGNVAEQQANEKGLSDWLADQPPLLPDPVALAGEVFAEDDKAAADSDDGPENAHEEEAPVDERVVVLSSLIPRAVARRCVPSTVPAIIQAAEDPFSELVRLVQRLQESDPEVEAKKEALCSGRPSPDHAWTCDATKMLRFKGRLWVPPEASVKAEILRRYHDDPLAGHFGVRRTEDLIQRHFHWKGMHAEIQEYVRSCAVCQRVVVKRHRPYGEMAALPAPTRPYSEVTMDFIVGLPPTLCGLEDVDSIFVVVDRYTRMAKFFPVASTINAAELACLFHSSIDLNYGAPEGVVSDRGSIFTSEFWSELAYQTRTKQRLSTAFHPQTDGQTERMNQGLEQYLRSYTDDNQLNWPALLPTAQYAINNALNTSIGTSPFRALMGFDPEIRQRVEDDAAGGGVPAVAQRLEKLKAVREKLEAHARKASETQAKYYNDRHQPKRYCRGDLVMLSAQNLSLKLPSRKLAPRFIGPFKVLDRIGTQAYRLALPEKYDIHNVFHVSLLEPFTARPGEEMPEMTMPDLEADQEQWAVEEIRGDKIKDGTQFYFVKWEGWPAEYNQWVPEEDLSADRLLQAYLKKKAKSAGKRKTPAAVKKKRGRPKKTA